MSAGLLRRLGASNYRECRIARQDAYERDGDLTLPCSLSNATTNCRGTTNFTKYRAAPSRKIRVFTDKHVNAFGEQPTMCKRSVVDCNNRNRLCADCDVVARLDRGTDAGDLARCLRAEKVSTRQLTLAARRAFTLPALHSHRPTALPATHKTFDHHVAQVVRVAEGRDAVGDACQALHEVDQAEVEVVF